MAHKVAMMLALAVSALSATAATIEKRTAGGEDVKDGELPFMVSLQGQRGGHRCGGALVDSTTVVTAAHCVSGTYSIKAGTANISTDGVVVNVKSRHEHPDYVLGNPGSPYAVNDIGVLKLETPVERSDTIDYVTLPADGSDPVPNSIAIGAGWGYQPDITPWPKQLSKVAMPVRDREVCFNLSPEGLSGRTTVICVGGDGKALCDKDSGGPVIDQDTRQLIGVVSFGLGRWPCTPKNPMVCTRVGNYISFIKKYL
ncbi:Trypsin [Metarhizium brunneum]|uniref:Trypsin n=1 Tax=Metarhizium brunneum TaxID=500148 RepID=A0A7D5V2I3_9HYPO